MRVCAQWRDRLERSKAITKVKQMELERALQLKKLQDVVSLHVLACSRVLTRARQMPQAESGSPM